MKFVGLVAIIVCAFVPVVLSTVGVDVSQAVSSSVWSCLHSPGGQGVVEFGIPRVRTSGGSIDTTGINSIKAARAAGIPYVDGYIFPCVSCGNPAGQVSSTVSALKSAGATFGMLWYDVEVYRWSDQASNRAFIQSMVDEGLALGIKAGIYTNYYNWESIVGASWSYPASKGLPLWYAHYDGVPSFADFAPFGGWTRPAIKQYMGNANSCGVGVDYNWYPSTAEELELAEQQLLQSNATASAALDTGMEGNAWRELVL